MATKPSSTPWETFQNQLAKLYLNHAREYGVGPQVFIRNLPEAYRISTSTLYTAMRKLGKTPPKFQKGPALVHKKRESEYKEALSILGDLHPLLPGSKGLLRMEPPHPRWDPRIANGKATIKPKKTKGKSSRKFSDKAKSESRNGAATSSAFESGSDSELSESVVIECTSTEHLLIHLGMILTKTDACTFLRSSAVMASKSVLRDFLEGIESRPTSEEK